MEVKSNEYLKLKENLYPKIIEFSKKIGEKKFNEYCVYAIKSQVINPTNISLGKINLAFVICFNGTAQPAIKNVFEKDFNKKYSDAFIKADLFKFPQRFETNQVINLKYFEHELNLNNLSKHTRSGKTEFPNYFTSLAPEGIILNREKELNPLTVKWAFRYDQIIKCSGFETYKFKQYLTQKLQEMFRKNECCVIYVSDWNIYANTHLFCSNKKEDWQCASEIEIFKASFYHTCVTMNIDDMHRSIKVNRGLKGIEKSDFLVKARSYYLAHEIIQIDLRFVPKETELFEYITKYKTIAYDLLEKFSVMIKPYCNKPFVELKYEEEKINCNYNFLFF
mgnify:CR=1 FL=1